LWAIGLWAIGLWAIGLNVAALRKISPPIRNFRGAKGDYPVLISSCSQPCISPVAIGRGQGKTERPNDALNRMTQIMQAGNGVSG
jgi:hypothetical protein